MTETTVLVFDVHKGGLVAPFKHSPSFPVVQRGGLVAPFKHSPSPPTVHRGGLVALGSGQLPPSGEVTVIFTQLLQLLSSFDSVTAPPTPGELKSAQARMEYGAVSTKVIGSDVATLLPPLVRAGIKVGVEVKALRLPFPSGLSDTWKKFSIEMFVEPVPVFLIVEVKVLGTSTTAVF